MIPNLDNPLLSLSLIAFSTILDYYDQPIKRKYMISQLPCVF